MHALFEHHVESIYEKATAPSGCESLVDQLVSELEFRSGGLYLEYLDRSSYQHAYRTGGSDSENQSYLKHYYKVDVWGQRLTELCHGQFHTTEKVVPFKLLQNTEFYDWLKEIDMHSALGCYFSGPIENQGFRLSFQHTKDQGSLSEKSRYLNRLAPHISRAFSLRVQLSQSQGLAANLAAIIDRAPLVAFAVNDEGRVLYRNAPSEALLANSGTIKIVNDKLCFKHPMGEPLQGLMRNCVYAAQGKGQAPKQTTFVLRNAEQVPEYKIRIEPHNGSDSTLGLQYRRALALVFVSKLNMALDLDETKVQFGLTDREAALASELAQGRSLNEIASRSHRSINTIKTHLRSVFAKTETSSQHQLVAKLRAASQY